MVTEGLTKRFGEFTAVDGISFSIAQGVIFGFLGPNGSGKTTTIRMLLGLLPPTAGRAWVLGHNIVAEPLAIRRRIGYMSQRFSLYGDLTVEENLNFFGQAYGVWGGRLQERKDFILEMAGLRGRERELARNLAGGWKRRLALGTAIIHQPEMLFLDEPTAGVDPLSRRTFWDLLHQLAEEGTTVFITTHYMDEAERCQELALIHQGQIVAQGSPSAIKEKAIVGQVLEIESPRPDEALRALQEERFSQAVLYGQFIHIITADLEGDAQVVRELFFRRRLQLDAVEAITPSLEDAFIALVGKE